MKIEAPAENRIIIELSSEDMSALNITYEDMDYSNIETRRVVWTLLDKAGHALNRDIDPSGKMIIEAIPAMSGGCVLNFTLCQSPAQERARRPRPVLHKEESSLCVYEFASLDDVMDAAAVCPESPADSPCELFELGGRYRLVLGRDLGSLRRELLLSEFGREVKEGSCAAACTREHWRCVVASRALLKLGARGAASD